MGQGLLSYGKSDEGRGIPVDEPGRNSPCHKIIITNYYENRILHHQDPIVMSTHYVIICYYYFIIIILLLFLLLFYYCNTQCGSLLILTQKWFLLFCDARNIIPSFTCSITQFSFLFIRFEKRFFAFDEIGLTLIVCMMCVSRRDNYSW